MQKDKIIEVFKSGHEDFRNLIISLTSTQLVDTQVLESWTVKDIISHISAWNWEQAKEIDNILQHKPTWNKLYKTGKDEDKFNKKAAEKRKNLEIKKIIDEWEKSFKFLIKRIEKLTDEEWNQHPSFKSLFHHEFDGASDESKHAKQVKKFFY